MTNLEDKLRETLLHGNNTLYDASLFQEIDNYIINPDIPVTVKNNIINLFLEVMSCCINIEKSKSLLPEHLKAIYISYEEFKRIVILFESFSLNDIILKDQYQDIVKMYIAYLTKEDNALFITYNYEKIDNFNQKIIGYLDKKDYNGILFKDVINFEELDILKELINSSKSR